MNFVVTNSQMKAAERLCGERYISYSKMMKNAGEGCAERIMPLLSEETAVCVLCGSGNNGGDGFVIAGRLLESGFEARVILAKGEPKTDISREYFSLLPSGLVFDCEKNAAQCKAVLENSDVVVDCVFGTGFHGALPEKLAGLMKEANKIPLKIAVDVPSGVNSDTGGFDEDCFKPDLTLVIAAMKKGLISPACIDILGKTEIVDIGIKDDCYAEFEAKLTDECALSVIPERLPSANKGTYGRLLDVAGSLYYSGAAAMSAKAALRTGAGLCTLASPISTVKIVASSLHETTYLPLPETDEGFVGEDAGEKIAEILPKMNAVCIGCGLGNSKNTRDLTEFVIKNAACPIVIDADGINSIADNINILKERTSAAVLTPHPLEFSRISGLDVSEIQRDRIKAARGFSEEYGVVVLLKGAYTVIAGNGGVFVNPTGNAALAKGGSGDVLAGMIAGLLAQGAEPLEAAASGAYIHGKAAERLVEKMPANAVLAGDLIDALF